MKKDNIRRNITLLMEYFNITSESQLARETGLGQATINKLISGATEDPRLMTLLPIAERYNLTLDTLVSDSPDFTKSKNSLNNREDSKLYIPLISFKELSYIFSSLDSLHADNWPYWWPILANSNSPCFAVKIAKNYFPEPFHQSAILVCEKSPELVNGIYCFLKHNDSKTISIMRCLKEADETWLLSLKKEIPARKFNQEKWTFLGTIRTMILDLSNKDFLISEVD
jgi:transcriptional regulator with XRE-family HTH domain